MNKYIHLFPYLIFMSAGLFAEQVYKSVDEEGNIIFSDTKQTESSEEINIKPAQTINMKQYERLSTAENKSVFNQDATYTIFLISNLVNEQTILNNQGNLKINFNVQPNLAPGHQISVLIDGVEKLKTTTANVKLENIHRGTHTVSAYISNSKGEKIVASKPITFYMRRTSKLHQQNQKTNNQNVSPLNPPTGQNQIAKPPPIPAL